MGHPIQKRIIFLSCCFLAVAAFISLQPGPEHRNKINRLNTALDEIPGWRSVQSVPLDPRVVKELELDDYLFKNYRNSGGAVDLYIGYYFSSKKVGAAHDPLVCFPGQGWALSNRNKGKIFLDSRLGEPVTYSRMVAERHSQRELIVYWFQAYDETSADTLSQKVSLFWKKMTHKAGDNAFVRVSMPLGDRSVEEGLEAMSPFVKAFYPVFLEYIWQGKETK